jgi:hypothetical protein
VPVGHLPPLPLLWMVAESPAVTTGRVHAREKQRGRERGLPTCNWAAWALCRWARDAGARGETEESFG